MSVWTWLRSRVCCTRVLPIVEPDEHDYEALLCSLLEYHLAPLLNTADKLAIRGVSTQLRAAMDPCFRSLDCPPDTLKTAKEIQRLRALLGRLVGLSSITLRSIEAVHALFNKDGTHACGTRLEGVAVKLVSLPPLLHGGCMHGALRSRTLMLGAACIL